MERRRSVVRAAGLNLQAIRQRLTSNAPTGPSGISSGATSTADSCKPRTPRNPGNKKKLNGRLCRGQARVPSHPSTNGIVVSTGFLLLVALHSPLQTGGPGG